ncbi:type II toxin-antitoxin system prevent-host-death family antitoxin [Caulobacter sp. SLTY]|uniref:type II toxin-antitoxin system Phd/YefM family antitoxin n=1 Tax=Caulobacter sp. SLTY TaxID=2683262 RepID=UPI001412FE42|nr:type II toxin-antitoxin system Phd/YefM family antitoxin [Caulobacter sp. SLTY]NBB15623.1 type II toxin-antitoxin system prevent-host-death family antitoxin [Caulobacter sp. SLTY]
MREVGILEAKTNLSALVDAVDRNGEEIVITKHGKPIARLSKAGGPSRQKTSPGQDLVARLRAVRAKIASGSPQCMRETWEDLKQDGHR